jgi:hypothetical protein
VLVGLEPCVLPGHQQVITLGVSVCVCATGFECGRGLHGRGDAVSPEPCQVWEWLPAALAAGVHGCHAACSDISSRPGVHFWAFEQHVQPTLSVRCVISAEVLVDKEL